MQRFLEGTTSESVKNPKGETHEEVCILPDAGKNLHSLLIISRPGAGDHTNIGSPGHLRITSAHAIKVTPQARRSDSRNIGFHHYLKKQTNRESEFRSIDFVSRFRIQPLISCLLQLLFPSGSKIVKWFVSREVESDSRDVLLTQGYRKGWEWSSRLSVGKHAQSPSYPPYLKEDGSYEFFESSRRLQRVQHPRIYGIIIQDLEKLQKLGSRPRLRKSHFIIRNSWYAKVWDFRISKHQSK
jgi:hypothetical protein